MLPRAARGGGRRAGGRWTAAAVALLLLAAVPLAGQDGADEPASAYERLEPQKLAETLQRMGMQELLAAYVRELGAEGKQDVASLNLLVSYHLSQARNLQRGPAREKLLQQAIEELDALIAALQKEAEALRARRDELAATSRDGKELARARVAAARALVRIYDARLRRVAALGEAYVEPYFSRLLYLQGSEEDRRVIRTWTAKALEHARALAEDVQDTLREWRSPPQDLAISGLVQPKLERLQQRLRYKRGWIRCYRGMALPTEGQGRPERAAVLADAAKDLGAFVRGGARTAYEAMRGRAMALRARARSEQVARERGRLHQEAQAHLEAVLAAGTAETGPRLQVLALFEAARNCVEWAPYRPDAEAPYEKAKTAIEAFGERATEVLGSSEDVKLQVAAQQAMLANYLYSVWADAVREQNPDRARELDAQAQNALADFLLAHPRPEVRGAFLPIIGSKYRDRADTDELNAMILLAIAGSEQAQGHEAAMAKAQKLLEQVVARQTELARRLRPVALWQLAELYARRGSPLEAGRAYLRIAKEHADFADAGYAAQNAVWAYHQDVRARRERGQAVPADVLRTYIEALATFLEHPKWPEQIQNARRWNYDLGQAYLTLVRSMPMAPAAQKAAWYDKAVRALERVPADAPSYLDAQYLALTARVERTLDVAQEGEGPPARPSRMIAKRSCSPGVRGANSTRRGCITTCWPRRNGPWSFSTAWGSAGRARRPWPRPRATASSRRSRPARRRRPSRTSPRCARRTRSGPGS